MRITDQRTSSIWPGLFIAMVVAVIALGAPFVKFTALTGAQTSSQITMTAPAQQIETTAAAATEDVSSARYSLRKVELSNGKQVTARWNPCQTDITFQINLSGVAAGKRAAMLAEIKTAFATLSAADGMTYRYTGATTFVPKQGNLAKAPAEIVVAAVSKSSTDFAMTKNSLGFGGVLWSTWTGATGEGAAVVRGYVVLNSDGFPELAAGFGKGRTQGNVILHELGHATGLDHVKSTSELMNPVLTDSAPAGYAAGDLAGLKKIGVQAGCVKIPSVVKIADLS